MPTPAGPTGTYTIVRSPAQVAIPKGAAPSLVVLDIDDTLLTPEIDNFFHAHLDRGLKLSEIIALFERQITGNSMRLVDPALPAWIRRVHAAGHTIVFLTARRHDMAAPTARQLRGHGLCPADGTAHAAAALLRRLRLPEGAHGVPEHGLILTENRLPKARVLRLLRAARPWHAVYYFDDSADEMRAALLVAGVQRYLVRKDGE